MTLFKHHRSESTPKRSYLTYFKEFAIPKQSPSFFTPKGKSKTQNKCRLASKTCTLSKQLAMNTWGYWRRIITIWLLLQQALSSRQERFASIAHQGVQHRQISALNRNGACFSEAWLSRNPLLDATVVAKYWLDPHRWNWSFVSLSSS